METYKNFVDFEFGTIPLIISVPHGGVLESESIPKRKIGIHGIDKRTIELSHEFISDIKMISKELKATEKIPSYLISNVRRSKIDLNREESKAFNSNSYLGKRIYQFYHLKVKEFILENLRLFNYSLLIDIHGFEKNKRPPGYRDVEIILGTNNLKAFFNHPIPKKEWGNNLRGKIIKRFLKLGIPIAPGHPRRNEYVLTGGFITQQYGASKIPNTQALQIEFSDRIRLVDNKLRSLVLHTLARVLLEEIIEILEFKSVL